MRKALQTEQGKGEMEVRMQQLESNEKDLERQVRHWASEKSSSRHGLSAGGTVDV